VKGEIDMKVKAEQLRLYAVTDRSWLKPTEHLSKPVEELLKGGVTCVQLREKEAEDSLFLEEAMELRKICESYQVPLIINDRPDIARKVKASGVHIGLSDMGVEKAREYLGENYIIGASAHNVEEAVAAQRAGADYIGCGAIFQTHTKKDTTALSMDELKAVCEAVQIPVVAIGGIQISNVEKLVGSGIAGVAVVSGLFAAENKTATAQQFLKLLGFI